MSELDPENGDVLENPEPEDELDHNDPDGQQFVSDTEEDERNFEPEVDACTAAAVNTPQEENVDQPTQAKINSGNQDINSYTGVADAGISGIHFPGSERESEAVGTVRTGNNLTLESNISNHSNNIEIDFSGADWSLEPEDAMNSQLGPGTVQDMDQQLEDEAAESIRNQGSPAGAETESSYQLQASGHSLHEVGVRLEESSQNRNLQNAEVASGAAGSSTSPEDVDSSPEEGDCFTSSAAGDGGLGPEAGGYMDSIEDQDPTEADTEVETGPVKCLVRDHIGEDQHSPEEQKAADVSIGVEAMEVGRSFTSEPLSSQFSESLDSGDKSVPEDEINSIVCTDQKDKVADVECYAPECDQSSEESSSSSTSPSPAHSGSGTYNQQPHIIGTDTVVPPNRSVSHVSRISEGNSAAQNNTELQAAFEGSYSSTYSSTNVSFTHQEVSDNNSSAPSVDTVTESVTKSDNSCNNTSDSDNSFVVAVQNSHCHTAKARIEKEHCDQLESSTERDIRFGSVAKSAADNRHESLEYMLGAGDGDEKVITAEVKPNPEAQEASPVKNIKDCLEEELLSELDATLENWSSSMVAGHDKRQRPVENATLTSRPAGSEGKTEGCDQCIQNNLKCSLSREVLCEVKELKRQLHLSKQLLLDRECEITRLKEDLEENSSHLEYVIQESHESRRQLETVQVNNADDLYIPQIKELEYTIAQQQAEARSLKDKLSTHDAAAKRAISTLQTEMKLRIDHITKLYEEAVKEKDSMVVKFAQAEHKNLEYSKAVERAEMRMKDMEKERENMFLKINAMKEQRLKMAANIDARNGELKALQNEIEKQREILHSSEVRVKWAQNKLKSELEAHKETKVNFDKTVIKLKEAKEETQMIRRDCQAIIKTYQESEEVKSNSLDKELKLKESELLVHRQQKSSQEEAHIQTLRELDRTKENLKLSAAEVDILKEKLSSIEAELAHGQLTNQKYEDMLQRQKTEIRELRERIEQLVHVKGDYHRAQELIKALDAEIADLKISNKDYTSDMEACRKRETSKMELTEKLSAKNADLQSENTNLSNKVIVLTAELQTLKMEFQEIDSQYKDVVEQFGKEQKLRQEETQLLSAQLAEKTKTVENLSRKVEEDKDEMKTLKRKHGNNIKDLTRQLQQAKRRLETFEMSGTVDKDTTSMGSRTSSNGSLNTVGVSESNSTQTSLPGPGMQNHNATPSNPSPEQDYVMVEPVEVDKQMLIERIVKLQRAHARKNEKIEFMEDHISQLVAEIKKKNKIIQEYVMREETGTMTSDTVDKNKAELAQKNSIMGSLYSSHSTDNTMTIELSLEINRKLQAVLEDTLLKNMTLKESLDTLGQEIARLSQENRRLQLHIQGKGKQLNR